MIPPRPTFAEKICQGWAVTVIGAALALGVILWSDGAVLAARCGLRKWQTAGAVIPAWRLRSPREWFQQARQHALDGDFQLALGTINYALAWFPDDSRLLNFEGNMRESLFQFREAQAVYEHALRADPNNQNARQNLVLCQRINRIRKDPGARSSTLYGLHRVMRDQGRLGEDLAIGRRLGSDRILWQVTWQEALDRTGLLGKVTVDDSGVMELDLAGSRQPDLSLIRDFPITRLNLAHTGLASIRDLQGLPLEKLDLTQTVVEDLTPLQGMPLKVLQIARTGVVNLTPLAECPLQELDISGTRVFDLAPLARVPLTVLRATDTPINDLRHLSALALTNVYLSRSRVSDLKPLSHALLEVLALEGTRVTDLSPLKKSPLKALYLASTAVNDLSPLKGLPLQVLTLTNCSQVLDLRPLVSCAELEHLLLPPNPRFSGTLTVLPRLRFMQYAETRFEDRLLM